MGAFRPLRLAKYIYRQGWETVIITNPPCKELALDFSLLNELAIGTSIHYVSNTKPLVISDEMIKADVICNDDLGFFQSNRLKNQLVARALGTGRDLLNRVLIPDIDVIRIPLLAKKVLRMLDDTKDKIILTTSPPHSIHLTGFLLAKIKKIPWIADFRDPWDNYPVTGHTELPNLLERLMERAVMKRADAVISSTETNTSNLIKKHQDIPKTKFYTITNAFDKDKVSVPANLDPYKFVITYSGIFYADKDPFTFFRALRSWFDRLDHHKRENYQKLLKVQLIGTRNSTIQRLIKQLGLEETVHFIDRVPQKEAIRLIKASDMLLMSYGLNSQTRPGCLPSKIFEYMGSRIPILAITREGELASIVRGTNSGYVVTSENHSQIHEILETEIQKKFSKNREERSNRFTFDGVEAFEERRVTSDMINVIERVLSSKR